MMLPSMIEAPSSSSTTREAADSSTNPKILAALAFLAPLAISSLFSGREARGRAEAVAGADGVEEVAEARGFGLRVEA